MKEIEALSDAELRDELKKYNTVVGPITGTTRSIYEKKLQKLLKEAGDGKKTTQAAKPKRTPSKSPARVPSRARSNTRRKGNKSESEDEMDSEEVVSPRPQSAKSTTAKLVVSTPKKGRTPSPETPTDRNSFSLNSSFRSANAIIPGLRTGLPPATRGDKSPGRVAPATEHRSPARAPAIDKSPARAPATDKSPARAPRSYMAGDDHPGATPPRRRMPVNRTPSRSSVRTAVSTTTYNNTFDNSFASSAGGRSLLDVGNTTGEEDGDDSDGGMETSRVVYSTKREGRERRSPLRKAWDRLLGNEFKAGPVPGTSYDVRRGSVRTRVDRDPVTGKPRVQQTNAGRDISVILMIVLSVFFVLLAVAYVTTARREAVLTTLNLIKASTRDTVAFFYKYAILPVILIGAAALLCVAVFFAHRWYSDQKQKESEMFEALVEKILDLVRESAEQGEEYISVPHVRDVIFPPAKRRSRELARWDRAVSFVNENESRVATELRVLRGQECAVWKWLPYKKSGWQGNAFATPSSLAARGLPAASPNVPEEALTRCLKIREIYEDRTDKDFEDEIDYASLEVSLREKVYPVIPVHLSFDKGSKEGLVFMKLRNRQDAKDAFTSLHGSWFNGHLVSVKYMRDRRYEERFPSTVGL